MTAYETVLATGLLVTTLISIYSVWRTQRNTETLAIQAKDIEAFKAKLGLDSSILQQKFEKIFGEQFRVAGDLQRMIFAMTRTVNSLFVEVKSPEDYRYIVNQTNQLYEASVAVQSYFNENVHVLPRSVINDVGELVHTALIIGEIVDNGIGGRIPPEKFDESNARLIESRKKLPEQFRKVFGQLQRIMGVEEGVYTLPE